MKFKGNYPSDKKAFKDYILKEYKNIFDHYPDGPNSYNIKVIIKFDGKKEFYTFEFIHGAENKYTVNVFAENSDYIGGGEFEQKIESNSLDLLIDKIFDVEYYGYYVGFGHMQLTWS